MFSNTFSTSVLADLEGFGPTREGLLLVMHGELHPVRVELVQPRLLVPPHLLDPALQSHEGGWHLACSIAHHMHVYAAG